ncbi:SDR family NAD(P)-dependent oxidoreductase [Natrialba sp. PRR66]|uniref:SDR family NAD(P)-dependent oxidoreductase n=1 Tax=Natrialba sp. PRR66 TaxID=3098146 RepID=UPI002B1DDEB6|nr:SDR family NAD(P)-dependent oxidoreductase [Natrialba sp. PRR66]
MLSDRVIIVAGGGHGLGEQSAIELGASGATVVVNDLGSTVHGEGESVEPAEETVEAVKAAGGDGMAHFGDISSTEYTEQLVADTVEEYGRVDGAVNFAGILNDSILYQMTDEEWDNVIKVHLRGHFALLRNLAAHWREVARESDDYLEDGRSFLSVSSRSALGNIGQSNYSAAKAGVLGLTRAAAKELGRYNVRVNALLPTAYTRMIEDIPDDQQPFTEEELPPEKVAPLVAYMLSSEASEINGWSVRAAGDAVGFVSDPEVIRLGYQNGGWTPEDIAERFTDEVGDGLALDKSGNAF